MHDISIERTTTAILATRSASARSFPTLKQRNCPGLCRSRLSYRPYDEPIGPTAFSRYDLRKMTDGARL